MESHGQSDLGRFAREHHVHYEVEPEEVGEGERRELAGIRLRLFATHPGAKLGVPGCDACVELLRALRSFTEQVVRAGHAGERAEILPARPKLYASDDSPEADEVALTVRVRCDAPEHRQPGAGEDRCLGEVRERLAELGVPRR
jgi:hypothetical protein